MGDLMDTLKKYLGEGRWVWVLVAAALLVVVAIGAAFVWPAIRPRPTPQLMSVPASSGATQTQSPATLPAVPEDVKEQIAGELGIDSLAALSMSYAGDTEHISVTQAVGVNDFKTYTFVQGEDGTWTQQ